MHDTDSTTKSMDHLLAECRRIEQFSQFNAATHFIMAARSAMWAKVLGTIPVTVGGLIAGILLWDSSMLGSDTVKWFGLATVLLGVISTVMAYLNPDRSRAEHTEAGTRYKTLENEARRAHQFHFKEEDKASFYLRVRELSRRYDELGELSPGTEDWAYEKAKTKVKAGEYLPSERGSREQ